MRLYDISRPLQPDLAVWPGDQPFVYRWTARIEEGSSVNISAIQLSVHAGTHVDAPLHYQPGGRPVDALPLTHFLGPAQVVEVRGQRVIRPADLPTRDALPAPQRILFKTDSSFAEARTWDPAFAYLAPDTVAALARQQVILVGIDGPSVDAADSTDLPVHHALAHHGIVNIENLMLRDVPPGLYRLIALPLFVPGLDAAPLRAVLTDL